jgi:hypothetical protein
LPFGIQDAAKHGKLVLFIGAGVSRLCGSPDWKAFAIKVVDQLERANLLSYFEADQLKRLDDPRRMLSIARLLAKESGLEIDYDSILHPSNPTPEGLAGC